MAFADPVSRTARLTAAARARESARPDRLFDDPWAAALAGAEGVAFLKQMEEAGRVPGTPGPSENPYFAIRTRLLDDFLTGAVTAPQADQPVRQVVILAAGLDTRAFRLPWSEGTRVYELDHPDVLAAKQATMDAAGAVPRCQRRTIGVDLAKPWAAPLEAAGYRRAQPSAWLVEGLFPYLDEAGVDGVLTTCTELAAPGARLACDIVGRSFLESPFTRAHLDLMAREGAPWRFGTDAPEALFAAAGWDAIALRPGDEGASFGRWPFPPYPRDTPGLPQTFMVFATRRSPG